jgi:anaerobic magnesium-protoporphyrin IX monomethyl ester cyclase
MQIRTALTVRVSSAVDKVDHPQFFDPCYHLKTIEAVLARQGIRVHSLDCWIQPSTPSELVALAERVRPDLVVLSSASFDVAVANDFARTLRARGLAAAVVGIGQGQYLNRDRGDGQDEHYDAVLLGEPEEEFAALLQRIRDDEPGWRQHYRDLYRRGHRFAVEDLDALPFPSYSRDELRAYRAIYPIRLARRVVWGFLIAGRGCPHGCTFCSEVMRVSVGTRMRIRSGKSVADEMEHLAAQGANVISFQDDSFASSRKLVHSVCDELIARGARIPWMARVRVDEVDREMLALMKQAGCVMLGIGVEAGAQRIIDRVHKTYKPKPWAELARRTFRWTRELGIGTNAYYVLGNPTETREEIEQTIALALELDADSIQVHFHTPYPGSADWQQYRRLFADQDPALLFHYAEPRFTLAQVDPATLVELRGRMYRRYLFRPAFALRHLWHYGGFYLRNPDILRTLLGIRKVIRKKPTQQGTSLAASLIAAEHDAVLTPPAAASR